MHVTSTSYIRHYEGDCLFARPEKGMSRIVSDADDFLSPLLNGDSLEHAAEKIAAKYSVDRSDVFSDMVSYYGDLATVGYVRVEDGDYKRQVEGSTIGTHRAVTLIADFAREDRIEAKLPIAQFYGKHHLADSLHLDLTDACTERCVHCYVPHGQHDFLPYAICEKVLREFREQQGLTAQLTGGECMMHPDFDKICRLCREQDLNFIVMSNLTLCAEKIVALLKETDPQFVNVSLYSMDEKEHDAVTQVPGSWRKTRAAIDALQEAGVAVRLATPLLKANQKAYPALKAFADERRVHLVPDCDIIPRCGGDCSNLNYACTPEEVEAVLAGDKEFWDRGYGKNPNIKPEDKVCDIGKLLSINSKGLYYPCSGMHEYVLGDARQMTLTDVWKGEKMDYLRGLKNRDFPQCVACEHRAFCKVCPAFNFNATGSLFKTIPAKCAVSAVKHKVYGGQ